MNVFHLLHFNLRVSLMSYYNTIFLSDRTQLHSDENTEKLSKGITLPCIDSSSKSS